MVKGLLACQVLTQDLCGLRLLTVGSRTVLLGALCTIQKGGVGRPRLRDTSVLRRIRGHALPEQWSPLDHRCRNIQLSYEQSDLSMLERRTNQLDVDDRKWKWREETEEYDLRERSSAT